MPTMTHPTDEQTRTHGVENSLETKKPKKRETVERSPVGSTRTATPTPPLRFDAHRPAAGAPTVRGHRGRLRRAAGLAARLRARWRGSGIEGTGAYGAGLAASPADRRGGAGRGRPPGPQDPPAPGQVRPGRRRGRRPRRPGRAARSGSPRPATGRRRRPARPAGGPPQRGSGPRRRPDPDEVADRHRPRRAAPQPARTGRPRADRLTARPGAPTAPPPGTRATATVPRAARLARRHQQLSAEIDELDTLIGPLVAAINPALLALTGVGAEVAGQLLVTAGDNPQRLRLGGGVRDALRGRTASRPRPGAPPPPAQPRRRPPGQRRALPDRALPAALGPPHPRLRRAPHHRGHVQDPRSSAASSATSPARSPRQPARRERRERSA